MEASPWIRGGGVGGSPRRDEDSVYETSSSVEIEGGRVSASVCWQPEAG